MMKVWNSTTAIVLENGLNLNDFLGVFCSGFKYQMAMLANRARTPPNLLGMERRIAYANRKYHSG